MNKLLVFFVFIICNANLLVAQDTVYVLHRAVGEKIDKNAKARYFLFPEITDSTFEYCVIKGAGGEFFAISHFANDSVSAKKVEVETLKQYHENIDKLIEYYALKSKRDSSDGNEIIALPTYNSPTLKNPVVSPALSDEQRSQVRQTERLKSDEERMNNYLQGTERSPSVLSYSIRTTKRRRSDSYLRHIETTAFS